MEGTKGNKRAESRGRSRPAHPIPQRSFWWADVSISLPRPRFPHNWVPFSQIFAVWWPRTVRGPVWVPGAGASLTAHVPREAPRPLEGSPASP